MVRELAEWNPGRYPEVLRWPLREALLSYLERLRAQARAAYRDQQFIYCMLAPHAKKGALSEPKLPPILRNQ